MYLLDNYVVYRFFFTILRLYVVVTVVLRDGFPFVCLIVCLFSILFLINVRFLCFPIADSEINN